MVVSDQQAQNKNFVVEQKGTWDTSRGMFIHDDFWVMSDLRVIHLINLTNLHVCHVSMNHSLP